MVGVEPYVLETILTLSLLIFSAKVGGQIAERFGIAPVVGELSAGILLGPTFLGQIEVLMGLKIVIINETVRVFAEVGAILLLFLAGLEMRRADFQRAGPLSASAALGGVLLPFLLGYGVMVWAGFSATDAFLVGATMTATSVAITVRTLTDLGKGEEPEATVLVSAAVIDDVLGLIILAVTLSIVGTGSFQVQQMAIVAGKALGFWVALTVGGALFLPKVLGRTLPWFRIKGSLQASAIALCFAYAYLAGIAGLAPILGAFAAGMAIAETRMMVEVREFTEKVSFLMAPLFFTVVGTFVDLTQLTPSSLLLSLALILLAVLGKGLGCGIPALLLTRDKRTSAVVGVGMISRGEVGLLIAGIGRTSGIIGPSVFTAVVLMVVVTTVVTPILLKRVYRTFPKEGGEASTERHKFNIADGE
jgi:Kef-type K+ transport system membrane component KefB